MIVGKVLENDTNSRVKEFKVFRAFHSNFIQYNIFSKSIFPQNSADLNHHVQTAEEKKEISNFRRALPQFCVVGVKNLILLGKFKVHSAVF